MDLNTVKNNLLLLIALFAINFSCSTQPGNSSSRSQNQAPTKIIDCYEQVKEEGDSSNVVRELFKQLEEWKNLRFFKNATLDTQRVDKTIFYDGSKERFFMAVLQISKAEYDSDDIRIIRGTKCNDIIQFEIGMNISVMRANNNSRTFDELRREYLEYVFRQGNPRSPCKIDDEGYWFSPDTEHLGCD